MVFSSILANQLFDVFLLHCGDKVCKALFIFIEFPHLPQNAAPSASSLPHFLHNTYANSPTL